MPVGRTRNSKNRDLARYVKRDRYGNITYKHPKMQSARGFGKDVAAANEVAEIVNARLSDRTGVISKILSPGVTFNDVLDRFLRDRAPGLKWANSYRAEQLRRIEKFRQYGDAIYEGTNVLFFTEIVEENFVIGSQRAVISLLRTIDKFAVGKGLRLGPNVCDGILSPDRPKRQRSRIQDLEEFIVIREQAPPYLQRAMNFALITLQPREVVCAVSLPKFSDAKLRVKRGKTKVFIEIAIGESLAELLRECRIEAMRLGSRKVICRAPVRGNSTEVKPDMLTRAFNKAVTDSGLWEENPPTFHEIRSLGSRLYENAGMPKEEIQNLMGHIKEETTEIYLENGEPTYIQASASLEI